MTNQLTVINSISDLINIVIELNSQFQGQLWWRGQRDITWNLSPSVYRKGKHTRSEQNLSARFVHKAPSRHSSVPPLDDLSSWLFLMQHYRLPTRLLDWTESPLIACFFASEHDPASVSHPDKIQDNDGSIYVISPYELNEKQIGKRALLLPDDPLAQSLIRRAFSKKTKEKEQIIAIRPAEVDSRLMVQLSVFTLHGTNNPIDDLYEDGSIYHQYKIPASNKQKIREQLKNLGIRESSIFPDLEHLAKDVSSTKFTTPKQSNFLDNNNNWVTYRDPESST